MSTKQTEALKLALAALEHEAEIGNDDAYRTERDAIREALAEQPAQQQEPVAIGRVRLDAGEVHIHPLVRDADKAGLVEGQPVYTSPPAQPSKPWQGLTQEEIQPLLSQNRFAVFALARAIEAKLKDKNGY